MSDKLQLFAPFAKVETTPDGGREVWGFATLERVDKQGEIIDYPSTVEALKAWSDEIAGYTNGKSLGNVRLMHTSNPIGKIIDWQEGETEIDGQAVKGVHIGTRVPAHRTDVISDIDEGILTGFSIGGSYAKRWYDPAVKATRYTPRFAEISYVDNPAVPGASFDMIKMAEGGLMVDGNLLTKAADGEREKLHAEAEARAKKYGIGVREGGSLTPPKGKPTDASDYGDPTNYAYPIDEAHIRAAVSYFNHPDQREKGGYSEEDWSIIGKRIADAANKLIGEGHEYKGGKIETSDEREEAEKAALTDLQKRAGTGGELSFDDKRRLIQVAVNGTGPGSDSYWVVDMYDDYVIVENWDEGKTWRVTYTIAGGEAKLGEPEEVRQSWEPVEGAKGAEKTVETTMAKSAAARPVNEKITAKIREVETGIEELKALQAKDPDKDATDKEVDARIKALETALDELRAAQNKDNTEDDMEEGDAEKAAQALEVLKTLGDTLSKRAVPISAARRKHLGHAMDHIHMAMGNDDAVQDKEHMGMADDAADKAAFAELIKGVQAMQKSAPDVEGLLAKALNDAALAKAADVSKVAEQVAKAAETLSTLEGRVKAIEEQPSGNGPMVTPMAPGLGGAMPWQQGIEKAALQNLLERTGDPVLKDALGRELAQDRLAEQLAQSRRPQPTAART